MMIVSNAPKTMYLGSGLDREDMGLGLKDANMVTVN
jgi:hypothetical protein